MNAAERDLGLNSYELRHLVGHLLDRGRIDDACDVLFAAGPSGESPFFEVRERRGDLTGLISDVALTARRLTAMEIARPALELKLALFSTTIRAIAAFEPVALIRARLQTGFWGRDEAVRFASAQSNPVVRADALMMVAELMGDQDNFAILRTALASLRPERGAERLAVQATVEEALIRLTRLVPDQARSEVLAVIVAGRIRRALIKVLPLVPERDLEGAIACGLELARGIADDPIEQRSLSGAARLKEGATGPEDQHAYAEMAENLALLSVRAPNREELFREAEGYAARTEGDLRLQTIARLSRSAPSSFRPALLAQVLESGLGTDTATAIVARELPAELDPELLNRVLSRAREIVWIPRRVTSVCRLALALPPEARADIAAEAIAALEESLGRENAAVFGAKILAQNASALCTTDQIRGLLQLFGRTGSSSKDDLLLALLKGTNGASEEVLQEALSCLAELSGGFDAKAFGHTMLDLSGREGLHYVNEAVQFAENDKRFAGNLMGAADASLQASVLPAAQKIARRMRDGSSRLSALCRTAQLMVDGPERTLAVQAVFDLADRLETDRAALVAHSDLIRIASGERLARITSAIGQHIRWEPNRLPSAIETELLEESLPFVPSETRMNWAVCTARRVRDIASSSKGKEELAALGVRVIALTALLPEDAREEIEAILIESVKTLRDEESQLETLGKMLPYISDSRRKEMAVAIFKKRSTMRGPERGTVFLNALACLPPDEPAIPPLTGAHLALLAYVDSQQISCGVCRLNVSGAAAACVNGLRFEAAVDEVTNIAFDWTLARAMRLLVARRLPMLDEPAAAAGWRKMLEKANRLPRWRFFTCVAEMVPLVARFWGPQELSLTWRAIAEIGTRWP